MIDEVEKITKDLFRIIKKAGTIITNSVNGEVFYAEKGEDNFVTKLDYDVQDYLINALLKLLPSSIIISEERNHVEDKIDNKYVWVIDPIDGTTNVIHNYPFYSISIALIKDSNTLIGITYNPVNKELFHAIKGRGAYLNNSKIKVSKTPNLKNALVGFGFPYDKNKSKTIVKLIGETVPLVRDLRRTGSAALDLAFIACGRLDGFFEFDLEIWDYAAGRLMILEAGGLLSDWEDIRIHFTSKMNVVASNKKIHSELLDILKGNPLPNSKLSG